MTTSETVVVARMIRQAIERRQWRSVTEKDVRQYARQHGADMATINRLLSEVRRQYDEAGGGYSGRFDPQEEPEPGHPEEPAVHMPVSVVRQSVEATQRGEKILVAPKEIMRLILEADKALNGDSNDAEHDALYSIRESLSSLYEDPDRRRLGK